MVENGGCAFPHEHIPGALHCEHGMSLRDYLACHILESLITPGTIPDIATTDKAYQWANLMIQSRKV